VRGLREIFSARIGSCGIQKILFPSTCPLCGGPSDAEESSPICATCWSGIARYAGASCSICARIIPSVHGRTCGECLADRPAFERAYSFGLYEGALKEAINLFKFGKLRRFARGLGRFLSEMELPAADAATAVPLTRRGLLARGFNQSILLARELSREKDLELLPHAVRKMKETPPQAKLERKERLLNLRGAFRAEEKYVHGKTVILVDDVMTTGSTVRQCSRALLRAGAQKVYVVTLARA
jgi:ComF family protein